MNAMNTMAAIVEWSALCSKLILLGTAFTGYQVARNIIGRLRLERQERRAG